MAKGQVELPPYDEPPEPYERYNPLIRYAHLPRVTREWLESLRKEDIEEIQAARRFYNQARTVGKVNLWIVGTILIASTAGASFGERVLAALTWMRGM